MTGTTPGDVAVLLRAGIRDACHRSLLARAARIDIRSRRLSAYLLRRWDKLVCAIRARTCATSSFRVDGQELGESPRLQSQQSEDAPSQ
jgi:hypothetical protein